MSSLCLPFFGILYCSKDDYFENECFKYLYLSKKIKVGTVSRQLTCFVTTPFNLFQVLMFQYECDITI